MRRFAILAVVIASFFLVSLRAGDDPKDKKDALKKAIADADLIVVGKVTKTGLVAASSFDVGEIGATRILKGDEKIKSAQFRYSGRVTPPYAKVGVEGVWVLSKADNKPGWRSVLSFQSLTEEGTVKALIKKEKKKQEEVKKMATETLIGNLTSSDGATRVAASAELFRRGKDVLPDLKKAGAKQVAPAGATIDGTRRLDMIYSVLEGFPPNTPKTVAGYNTDAFGVHVEKGTTEDDVQAMAKRRGCALNGKFNAEFRPSCYFRLGKGHTLEKTIRQVLVSEPKVVTINLNYIERKLVP
jgi:hypothetical protein